ncbi:CCT motif family protein [Rhynchospora pubera]|uniref:CCT motif family protein n=1 Tax=Rhynchospora pubera TaxID=906938 RepID=A0AAV8F6A2_9POAL|nr:CCT motif family protein [Rhynchospora pubera]
MYADAGLEFGISPGFLANHMATPNGRVVVGHCDPYQQQVSLADAALFSSCSSLADGGTHVGTMVQSSILSEYDLGAEGDLFKAPELILEEPVLGIDPVAAAAISIISNTDDIIADTIKVSDIQLIQTEQLLNDVFFECKKDLLEKSAIEETTSLTDLLDVKLPPVETILEAPVQPVQESVMEDAVQTVNNAAGDKCANGEGNIQKSVSSGCLNSMEWVPGCSVRPNFLDFQGLDLEVALGLRRAYSEGDIQNLGSNNIRIGNPAGAVQTSFERLLTINDLKSEERRQKLSRYRKKKIKRNFGRKIKYACRKALADSQPRVRGRFAKIEECEIPRANK